MEQINFQMSDKNIPISENLKEYRIQMAKSVTFFATNVRFAVKAVLNPHKSGKRKETFGFKTAKIASQVPELKEFERGLFELTRNIKHSDKKEAKSDFQKKLDDNIQKVKRETKVFVKGDKSSNYYVMEKERQSELMLKEVHKDYRKADATVENDINTEAKQFATNLDIEDRVFRMEKRKAMITIKDHKPGFMDNPKVRLINPTKSELGRAAKQMLARINKELKETSGLIQWESDLKCIDWFNALENKPQLKFLKCDIDSFYPSITEELLNKALTWADTMVDISEEEKELFTHTKKSLLWDGKEAWVKKGASLFDVTMGSFDGAETCDIVGLFLLSELSQLPIKVGLYRDDVLSVSELNEQQVERVGQQMREIFQQHGLGLKVEANMRVTDFLDVLFDLKQGTHVPQGLGQARAGDPLCAQGVQPPCAHPEEHPGRGRAPPLSPLLQQGDVRGRQGPLPGRPQEGWVRPESEVR